MNIPNSKNKVIDVCGLLNIENSLLGVLYFQHTLGKQFSFSLPDFLRYIDKVQIV